MRFHHRKNIFLLTSILALILACDNKIPGLKDKTPKRINIHVAFGYKDARPARFVGDRYERIYFIEQLLKNCDDLKNQACGFSRSPDDGNLLTKVIPSASPINIQIKISGSSAGPDDDENRKDPYQKILSQKSQSNFLGGVNNGNTTIYIGHSRDGGGPDFAPPILGKSKHVAYEWYHKHHPGLNQLKEALKSGDDKVKKDNLKKEKPLLALLSCASDEHFTIDNLGENLNLRMQLHTVKGLIYYSEALNQGLSEISNYLSGQ